MFCKLCKINTLDITQYVHKYGMTVDYTPITGLPSKYTLDGSLHDDSIGNVATYTYRLNPVGPDVAKMILQEYRNDKVFLTTYDPTDDDIKVILCKTSAAKVADPYVKYGDITYWQLSPLIFRAVEPS